MGGGDCGTEKALGGRKGESSARHEGGKMGRTEKR